MIDWNYVFLSDVRSRSIWKKLIEIKEIAKFYRLPFWYVYKIYRNWNSKQ